MMTSDEKYPSPWQANYALTMLVVAYILSYADRQILSLLVDPIRASLGITDFQVSLLHGLAFACLYTVMGIPIARLADRYSRRLIITAGILFWSVMTAGCGMTKQYSILFLARMGVGIGEATLSPAAYSMLSDYFPPHRLGRATSIFTIGISIGAGMAYILGGWVIQFASSAGQLTLPFFGELSVWQACFIIISLPGVLVALLMYTVREPVRKACLNVPNEGTHTGVPFGQVLGFFWEGRRCYLSIFVTITLLGIVGTGILAWFPTSLIRSYGVSATEVGYHFGLIYLFAGTCGAFFSGFASERLSVHYSDANLRVIFFVTLALIIPAIAVPLMPSYQWALIIAVPMVFLLNAFFGVSIAALQLVTPNEMRAQISSLFLFCTNIAGLAIGPAFIALITDMYFEDDQALRYSLVLVSAVVLPLAALTGGLSLKPYRDTVDKMHENIKSKETV